MKKMRRGILLLLVFTSCFFGHMEDAYGEEDRLLSIVTPSATQETKELFDFLRGKMNSEDILFGQQHATDEGLTLIGEAPRAGSIESEIKNAVGDYPAVFGWDTLSLDGYEKPGISGDKEASLQNVVSSMKTAHELGGVIVLSMHPYNFVTGGNYGDTTGEVVKNILPGGTKNQEFNQWLDQIAKLANQLVDVEGNSIPLIFRPFHEQNGSWFWWGASTTSTEQYIAIFRYTVEYLRDIKKVDNILYAYSPGSTTPGDTDAYLKTYPGDDYVDLFGIDSYDNKQNAGSQNWINGLVADLEMIVNVAEEKGKIAALTEYGYSAQGINKTGNTLDWYTRVLDAVQKNEQARKISYMLTWANFGWPNNMFVPYKDVNGDLGGDHELLPDFQKFYESDGTGFAGDIDGNIYDTGKTYQTKDQETDMYLLSPTEGDILTSEETPVYIRVTNDDKAKVTMEIEDSGQVTTLEKQGRDFTGTLKIPHSVNGGAFNLIVKYYSDDELQQTEKVRLFAQVEAMALYTLDFDTSIEGIASNGRYPETGDAPVLSHYKDEATNQGFLKTDFTAFSAEDSWQEMKYQLTDVDSEILSQTNQIKIDAYLHLPAASQGQVKAVSQWTDNWDNKYGEAETSISTEELEIKMIGDKEYRHVIFTIHLPHNENGPALAFSIVGESLTQWDQLLLNSVQLLKINEVSEENTLLVDDFESYFGDDSLLERKYGSNGDPVRLSLSDTKKNSGDFGMKYAYSLGANGYAGRQIAFNKDWTTANALSFWLSNPGNNGNHLTIQVQIGGVSFEYEYDLAEEFEGILTVPFDEFKPASWEANQQALITKERLVSVSQFAIYVGGEIQEGELFVDDIQAVYSEELPDIDDQEEETTYEPLIYNFESEEGWVGNSEKIVDNHFESLINSGTKQKSEISLTESLNLSSYNWYVARVKLPEEVASVKAKLFVKTGNSWTWFDSGEFSVKESGYTDLLFPIISIENLESVQQIGIEVIGQEEEGKSTKIWLDFVAFVEELSEIETIDDQKEPIIYSFDNELHGFEGEDISHADGELSARISFSENSLSTEISKKATFALSGYRYIVAKVKREAWQNDSSRNVDTPEITEERQQLEPEKTIEEESQLSDNQGEETEASPNEIETVTEQVTETEEDNDYQITNVVNDAPVEISHLQGATYVITAKDESVAAMVSVESEDYVYLMTELSEKNVLDQTNEIGVRFTSDELGEANISIDYVAIVQSLSDLPETEEVTYSYEISGPDALSVNRSALNQATDDGLKEVGFFRKQLENQIIASKISSQGDVEIVPWNLTINQERTVLTISIAEVNTATIPTTKDIHLTIVNDIEEGAEETEETEATEEESGETEPTEEETDSDDTNPEVTYILEVPKSIQVNKQEFEEFIKTNTEEKFFKKALEDKVTSYAIFGDEQEEKDWAVQRNQDQLIITMLDTEGSTVSKTIDIKWQDTNKQPGDKENPNNRLPQTNDVRNRGLVILGAAFVLISSNLLILRKMKRSE